MLLAGVVVVLTISTGIAQATPEEQRKKTMALLSMYYDKVLPRVTLIAFGVMLMYDERDAKSLRTVCAKDYLTPLKKTVAGPREILSKSAHSNNTWDGHSRLMKKLADADCASSVANSIWHRIDIFCLAVQQGHNLPFFARQYRKKVVRTWLKNQTNRSNCEKLVAEHQF